MTAVICKIFCSCGENQSYSLSSVEWNQWNMSDAAFSGGVEALIFEGNKGKIRGAIKIYLGRADGVRSFQLRDGSIFDISERKQMNLQTGMLIPRQSAIANYQMELKALKASTNAECPWIVSLLRESSNARIESGMTFTQPRSAPVIITELMIGGSIRDMILTRAAAHNQGSIKYSTLQRWKKQMLEAAMCAAKHNITFKDRNAKNFVLDNQDCDQANVFVIDIEVQHDDEQSHESLESFNRMSIQRFWKDIVHFYGDASFLQFMTHTRRVRIVNDFGNDISRTDAHELIHTFVPIPKRNESIQTYVR